MSNTTAFSYEQLVASSKPQHLTASIFAPIDGIAEKAYISVEGGWRVMYHGGEPSTLDGHVLRDGSSMILNGELSIKNFRAISLNEHSVMSVSYERK